VYESHALIRLTAVQAGTARAVIINAEGQQASEIVVDFTIVVAPQTICI